LRRIRRGRGFSYLDEQGDAVTAPETLLRIRELAIPPAWKEVWICGDARGHLRPPASILPAASSTSITPYGAPARPREVRASASIQDPDSIEVLRALMRRHARGNELLGYRNGRRWLPMHADDINDSRVTSARSSAPRTSERGTREYSPL
jgi:hypothetical protein